MIDLTFSHVLKVGSFDASPSAAAEARGWPLLLSVPRPNSVHPCVTHVVVNQNIMLGTQDLGL